MSLKASNIIASVRATLDYPSYDKLKQQLVVLKLREKVDHYFNRMSLTDRNWFLDSYVLPVSSGESEYVVEAPSWGRPVLCETQDLSDQQHMRRSVKIIDLHDRELFYSGPEEPFSGEFAGDKHSAAVWTFFRRPGGELTAKVTPTPAQTADYVFWFEPNRPLPTTLAGNLTFLDNFQNLLVVDLALTLLPYCEYDSVILTETYYKKRTKADALREGLQRDFTLYLQTFEEYIQQDRQQKVERKQLWGDSPTLGDEGYY